MSAIGDANHTAFTTATPLRTSVNADRDNCTYQKQLKIACVVAISLFYGLGAMGTTCSINCGFNDDESTCPTICQSTAFNIILIIFGIGGIIATCAQREIKAYIEKQ